MANATELMMTMISTMATMWPPQANVSDGCSFDFVIIGTGAGAVVANRLTERSDFRVLLIEAGDIPTDDTGIPAQFASLTNTSFDWKFTSEIEPASISQEKGRFSISHGKVLGGSSCINHQLYLRGDQTDFDGWADMLDDETWKYDSVLPYFIKIENMRDEAIINSPSKKFHGSNGLINITTQPSDVATKYLEAFHELDYPVNSDINSDNMMGYGLAQYNIDLIRQDTARTYILDARDRPNFHLLRNTLATKVVIENKVAVGVEVILENGEKITIKAEKEVIVCAGAVNSPKILSLSGIGEKNVLGKYNITVVSDLPVGRNLQEHVAVPIVFKMDHSTAAQSAVLPEQIPFPVTIGSVSVSGNDFPDYQSINLLLEHDTEFLMTACSTIFGLKTETCTMFVNESVGRNVMFSLVSKYKPESRGSVQIQSSDPYVDPIIKLNLFGNETDLSDMVIYIKDFLKISNSTYFKNAAAEVIKPELSDFCGSYWKCYAMNHAVNLYHPTSTCAMGSVLDSKCKVKGVDQLRVVDSSALPTIPRANILAAILMLAEKISDVIKNSHPAS